MVTSPRACSYCSHIYANPCDGQDPECGNKKFIDGKAPGVEPRKEEPPPVEAKPKTKRVPLTRK